MHVLKIHRGVMCNNTKEWWNIWRGTDSLFHNWHMKFDKFWLEHLNLKHLHFKGLLLTKVYIVWAGKVRRTLESDAKFEKRIEWWFGKWHEEFGKISPEHMKVSKLGLLLGPFMESRKFMSLKLTGKLCVKTMKKDTKFEK